MPGYSAQAQSNTAQSGNTVSVLIGTTVVAFAQTVNMQLPMGTEQLYGIGTAMVQEVQQLRMAPQITVDAFALTAKGQQLLGNGQNLAYLLAGNIFEISILDSDTNEAAFTFVGCKAQNFAKSIPTNSIIRDTFTFAAQDVQDADGNSILNVPENALQVVPAAAVAGTVANNLGLASPS